jgi:hypothetical protein
MPSNIQILQVLSNLLVNCNNLKIDNNKPINLHISYIEPWSIKIVWLVISMCFTIKNNHDLLETESWKQNYLTLYTYVIKLIWVWFGIWNHLTIIFFDIFYKHIVLNFWGQSIYYSQLYDVQVCDRLVL